jgi:hypothetical protein
MPDDCYINYVSFVVNPIYDTIISDPNPPKVNRAAQFLASDGAGKDRKRFDLLQHSLGDVKW